MSELENNNINIKRFGFVLSAFLIIISVISLMNQWAVTPILFIIMMYFLTASLWAPALITGLYNSFGKYIVSESTSKDPKDSSDIFNNN